METALLALVVIALVIGWVHLRNRLADVEARLARLEWQKGQEMVRQTAPAPTPLVPPAPPVAITAPPPAPTVAPPPPSAVAPPPPVIAAQPPHPPFVPPAPPRPSIDWETTLGGNWLNKLGVFIFVIGLALALGYSFTRLGPAGRVTISLAVSFAMLLAGAVFERRELYRTFGRGLLGGGWAGLYTTVYAMQAVPAALVIHNAVLGAVLLLAVAAGMVVHSLRYRAQSLTALAYFIAFSTLAINQVTWLSAIALIPLAASLLYIAYRLRWRQIALLGLVATWSVTLLRGDTGTPLWPAQAVLAVYWLLFEAFDLFQPDAALLPLNAAGFLGLSLLKWQSDTPDRLWQFLAAASAAYLAGALLRASRRHNWLPAATLSAALITAAIFLHLQHQWISLGLLVEAELVYLAGLRLGNRYLRALGAALMALHLGHLLIAGVGTLPLDAWVPLAALDAAVFYANRALCAADVYFGYAGAAMLALIVGYKTAQPLWGRCWLALGVGAFAIGWWRRLFDFRAQGYLLAILGAAATALYSPHPPFALAAGAAIGYAAVLCTKFSSADHLAEKEAAGLRIAGSITGTYLLANLFYVLLPPSWVAPAWAALALALVAAGERWQSAILMAVAFVRCLVSSFGAADWHLTATLTIACVYAAQLLAARASRARLYYSLLATVLTTALIWDHVSGSLLTVVWGLEGVLLLSAGFPLRDRIARLSGLALLFICILKLFLWDLRELDTFPRIVSFLALGLILVGVSWIYTRFRARVARYL